MTNLRQTWLLAWRSIIRNGSRSLLTMLGMIIGVAAVIVTIAVGSGAQASVSSAINGLGSNLIIVQPGSTQSGGARTGNGSASTLTVLDGLAIAQLPTVQEVSPLVNVRAQVVSGSINWQSQISGVAPTFMDIRHWTIAGGRFLSQADADSSANVAVLGQTVVNAISPGQSALGKQIFLRGVPFTVIGTLNAKGQSGIGQDQDDVVFIPYSAALERLSGGSALGMLMVSANNEADIPLAQTQITGLLEQRHRLPNPANLDFQVSNLADVATTAASTAATLTLLLTAVAGVSLLVGGIGIMNIMLVSVTERTREIGLRIALGARSSTILQQFLTEALVLAMLGGACGVLLGVLGAQALTAIGKWPTSIPLSAIALAVVFSGAIGIFFGYWPARQAAQLDPIRALRFE